MLLDNRRPTKTDAVQRRPMKVKEESKPMQSHEDSDQRQRTQVNGDLRPPAPVPCRQFEILFHDNGCSLFTVDHLLF